MTDRQRILAAVRGEPVDRIPFVPRLEFWHRSKLRDGTLPLELRGLSLIEIADRLGVGYYHVIPDLTERRDDLDMIDYALGIYRSPTMPFEPALENVERKVLRRGRETVVEYHTPVGSIRTETIFTDEMLEAGASVPWKTRHPIERPEDFEVVGYIFAHARVEPRFEGFLARQRQIGERGIVVGYTCGSSCPVHHILRELMPVDQFFYAMNDSPGLVQSLAAQMEPYYQKVKEIAADSPAEVVYLGGNYDDSITYPPFFRQHILPALREYTTYLHGKGKLLLTHTDGENRRLLPLYLEAGFDVADSVCPHPMTSLRIEEILEAFRGRVTVWGGIPSVLLCPSSAPEAGFRRFIDNLLERYGHHNRLILGVSDMVTADCDWDRLRYIAERVATLPA